MMNKIRWGVAGPGGIARTFGEAIKNVKGVELSAVASTSKERAEKYASEFSVPNVFSSYEEMAKSDCIDAVYVSTAHPFHKATAEIFLKHKKGVLCEKPLCVNADEAKSLICIAKENGMFLMEAMWTRFLPAIRKMEEIIESGEIGEPLSVTADFSYSIEREEDPKLFENSLAGGSLLDVGVYALHFASIVFRKAPEKIFATAKVENGVDYHTQMLLVYKNGASAALSSGIKLQKPYDARIFGTKGSLYLPDFYKANRIVMEKDGEKTIFECPYHGTGFENEIIEASECIRRNKTESDIVPYEKTMETMALMDEVRKQIGVSYPSDKGI